MKNYKRLQNPIIFIGSGRSGSTIISEIISKHKDLAYISSYNNRYYKNRYVNFVRLLFDNPLYKIYGQKKQLNKVPIINKFTFKPSEGYAMWNYLTGSEIDFSRGFLVDQPLSDEKIDFIRNYFNSMVKFQNKKRLVFKITGPSRISFLLKIFPDAIFINLKRNYVPTIASFLKVEFWKTRGYNQLWWTGVYDDHEKEWAINNKNNGALMTAYQLKKINDITDLEIEKLKPKYLEIIYESFVENPKKEIKRIIDFTNLAPINFDYYLQNVKIFNQNKKDTDYFEEAELKEIYKIINPK